MSVSTIPYEKYHGTGNDFIVVDAEDPVPDRPAFAMTHCDRESGVGTGGDRPGADGVLFLALEEQFSPPRVVMTLVQPDGSVAAMCGNGGRVAAAWAARRTGASEVMIDTPAGTRRATVHRVESRPDGDDDVTIEMGVPSFATRDIPLARDEPLIDEEVEGLAVTAVNTGVPHAVAFVDDVDAVDLESVAPPVRHADVFPEGANVTIASPEDDVSASDSEGRRGGRDASGPGFAQRTFERGVEGETRSCGTGAVAVVAAAQRLGLHDADGPVRVSPPGGDLEITVPGEAVPQGTRAALVADSATLRGPVVRQFDGEADVVFRPR